MSMERKKLNIEIEIDGVNYPVQLENGFLYIDGPGYDWKANGTNSTSFVENNVIKGKTVEALITTVARIHKQGRCIWIKNTPHIFSNPPTAKEIDDINQALV